MFKSGFWKFVAPSLVIVAAALAIPSIAMQGDTIADRVLGQADFSHNSEGSDASGLASPGPVTIDTSVTPNRLYVSDYFNNRVLGWRDTATFTNGQAADLVIGQPDFLSADCNNGGVSASSLCFPYGVAADANGNLYVADYSNKRVLEYTAPFAGCGGVFPCVGGPANMVIGHGGSFTANICSGVTADTVCGAGGVALDANGNLYVGDYDDNRVLEYNNPLAPGGGTPGTPGSAGDTTADKVFGQGGSFTVSDCNNGGDLSADTLCHPFGVALDASGDLWVPDNSNNRVLEYDNPLTPGGGTPGTPGSAGDTTADLVFGQGGDFTTGGCNHGSADDLCAPYGTALDSNNGNLYVADGHNNRVLEYNDPLTPGGGTPGTPGSAGDTTADQVFGQGGSFTSSDCNFDTNDGEDPLTASDLCVSALGGGAVALDPIGNLYVADSGNNRVLEYDNPTVAQTTTATVTATLAFGNVPVGDIVTKSITVKNTGAHPLFVGSVTSNDPEFAETGTTCPGGGLAHLATCAVTVGFTPTSLGLHSATLLVNDNASSSPQHVSASGTGVADMTVTPTSFAFGSVMDGSKATKTITVSNKQNVQVSLTPAAGFTGMNAGDFSVTGGTCTSTLAAKTSCTLIVTFKPTAVGTESATMTVTDSPDTLGPYTVTFSATANIPESFSPKTLNYGKIAQSASKTLSVTVTNNATSGSITLTGTNVGGANAGDFAVTGGSCGISLGASSSCTYAVTFTPSSEGAESGSLSIGVAQDPTSPRSVSLLGTGASPITATPLTGIAFGTIVGGHSSVNKTVTVTNNGAATLTISESVTGTNSTDFAVTGGTCGASLAGGGAHCTYLVKFTPSIVGAESATIGVSAVGDGASPHNVSLSGTGS